MSFERRLSQFIDPLYRDATPGLKLQVFHEGKMLADIAMGETKPYYDWASLTKIVFSTTVLMRLALKYPDLLHLDFSRVLPGFRQRSDAVVERLDAIGLGGIRQPLVTFERLLTHSAGFTWWKPFYAEIDRARRVAQGPFSGWRTLKKMLLLETPDFQGKAVYSDIDFFLIGFALEEIVGRPLEAIWKELAGQIGLEDVHFCSGNQPLKARDQYAPTENDPARGGVLQGQAHDENTFAVGGVASHAGLFGTMESLSKFGLMLRACLNNEPEG
ncbi:MAG: serine hydrolase, partial [Bdellovibrionales bacterium]|nr:serine hydrolase [Bdellovibrionales bacterium]